MTVEIKLDTAALNSLFPEGSDARVALSQAVVQNFVNRKFIKMTNDEIHDAVHHAAKEFNIPNLQSMVDSKLENLMEGYGYNRKISGTYIESIRKATEYEIKKYKDQIFDDAFKKVMTTVEPKIDSLVKRYCDNLNIEAGVVRHVNKNFASIVDEAIKQKLGL